MKLPCRIFPYLIADAAVSASSPEHTSPPLSCAQTSDQRLLPLKPCLPLGAGWDYELCNNHASIIGASDKMHAAGEMDSAPLVYLDICNGIGPIDVTDLDEFKLGQLLALALALIVTSFLLIWVLA
jgi:hypothetical protein